MGNRGLEQAAPRLIVLDMDGTLLDDQLQISKETINYLNRIHQAGIVIAFATGRVHQSALEYARLFPFAIPLITSNGSVIKDSGGRIYSHRTIPGSFARQMLLTCKAEGMYTKVYIDNTLYIRNEVEEARRFVKQHRIKLVIEERVEDKVLDTPPEIIVILDESARLDRFIQDNQELLSRCYYTKSEDYSLEIGPSGASKGKALALLAEELSITSEEIIAFGNNINDLSMIEYAGTGVAMADSPSQLKERANLVTLDNNEDGVLHMLKKLALF